VAGTDDDGRVGDTKAHERRLPFARIPGGDQYMVTLLGGDHDVYCTRSRQQSRAASDAHYQSLICTASTRFWDAYLKRDPAAQAALAGNDRPQPLGRGATIERRLQASADAPSLGAAQQSASATR
jgi:hypothetical protein